FNCKHRCSKRIVCCAGRGCMNEPRNGTNNAPRFDKNASHIMVPPYITIIGLEVHVQLSTASKLFCACRTKFGAEPNTQTCPVCIGMPGTLPVMNRNAFQLALKTAVALSCEIPAFTKW